MAARDPELVRRIRAIVREYKEVIGVHDLIVHEYGAGNLMVSLHAEVPADGDLNELHDVIDVIEQRLKRELNCHAVIHMDPLATNDSLVGETRQKVQDVIREELNAPVTIHDFRMVTGPTHTNVIFDAVIPNELSISDEQARKEINRAVSKLPATTTPWSPSTSPIWARRKREVTGGHDPGGTGRIVSHHTRAAS